MGTKTGVLGELEHMVLVAVLRLDDEAYGAAVAEEIERRTGRPVAGGSLYVTFDRLEAKGLLESRLGEPQPGRGGRGRRYLSVTGAGREAVRASRAALMALWRGIEEELQP